MNQPYVEEFYRRVLNMGGIPELQAEWANEHGGLKEAKTNCPSRLFGKRCTCNLRCPGCNRLQRLLHNHPYYDHPSLWLKDGKPYVFVLQPYEWEQEAEDALAKWCEENDLTYKVRPKSDGWWVKNGTYLIEVYAGKAAK
jgi:hypothetical protein